MANKKVCSYCGTIYSAQMKRCPLCGSEEQEETERLDLSGMTQPMKAEPKKRAPEPELENQVPDEPAEMEPTPKAPQKAKTPKEKKEKKNGQSMPKAVAVTCVVFLSVSLFVMTWYLLAQWFPNTIPFPSPKAAQEETVESSDATEDTQSKECWYLNCDVEKLTLSHEGAAKTLQIDIQPEDCTDELTFASADATVARVDQNGIVTAIGDGQTTITVTCGALSVDVTVICDFSAKIELNQSEVEFTSLEDSAQLQLLNLGESDVVTWQSSDESVVTVDENGNLKPVGNGVCTVTAEMDGQMFMATVTVNTEETFDPDKTYTGTINADGIYFRSGPSSDSEAIGFFMKGYEVEVLGKEDEWYNVEMNGKTGYVHENYLDLDE